MLNSATWRQQAPKSTVGQPMAVYRQGIYVEYSMEYSKCRSPKDSLRGTLKALPRGGLEESRGGLEGV
eukprot:4475503-Pyramimonas_sp.AAC.1